MKAQACEPCAKRKVRCDRSEPSCSNCKRRKVDTCRYPDPIPTERIKRLEDAVKLLGGDPNAEEVVDMAKGISPAVSGVGTSKAGVTVKSSVSDPVIIQGGNRSVYLESQGWQSWVDAARVQPSPNVSTSTQSAHHESLQTPGLHLPHAFQGFLRSDQQSTPSSDSSNLCPAPSREALRLWDVFIERVEPVIRINFEWTLRKLQFALTRAEYWKTLSHGEQSLTLSCLLFAIVSLTNSECLNDYGVSRAALLSGYRGHCENAFARVHLLVIEDIPTLKALCIYTKASIDLTSSHSLWSLLGLISRSAEKMGVHRDGDLFQLPAAETEERRRLWWQIQHLDLILGVKNGVTALGFTADWDTKLPLNIEDADLEASGIGPVVERKRLTGMAWTLFSYWVIHQQRTFRQKRLSRQTLADRSLLGPLTDQMIDEMEEGLNSHFLQHCDPIVPLHGLVQISARALVCLLRLRRLHELRLTFAEDKLEEGLRDEYFSMCVQSLRYNITAQCQPLLRPFQWMTESSFPWHAFIGLLVDLPQLPDLVRINSTWTLLSELYSAFPALMNFLDDRRRAHAASAVVMTWRACQERLGAKPAFLDRLEQCLTEFERDAFDEELHQGEAAGKRAGAPRRQLAQGKHDDVSETRRRDGNGNDATRLVPENCETQATAHAPLEQLPDPNGSWPALADLGEPFDFNFAEIDWSFWHNIV